MLKTIRNLLVFGLLAGGFGFTVAGNTGCSSDSDTGAAGTSGGGGTTGSAGTSGGGGAGGVDGGSDSGG